MQLSYLLAAREGEMKAGGEDVMKGMKIRSRDVTWRRVGKR